MYGRSMSKNEEENKKKSRGERQFDGRRLCGRIMSRNNERNNEISN